MRVQLAAKCDSSPAILKAKIFQQQTRKGKGASVWLTINYHLFSTLSSRCSVKQFESTLRLCWRNQQMANSLLWLTGENPLHTYLLRPTIFSYFDQQMRSDLPTPPSVAMSSSLQGL